MGDSSEDACELLFAKEISEDDRKSHLEYSNGSKRRNEREITNSSVDDQSDELENRFETIFDNSLLGNKIINSDLVIVRINQAIQLLMGYEEHEIVGHQILEFVPAEHRQEWRALQKNLWEKSIPAFELESSLRKKDGSIIWCQITSILFKDQGELFGYTIIQDITEKKKLQQQKDEFIGIVSHELKTPVTSIKAFSQILLRSAANPQLPVFRIFLERMNAQINRLTFLIHDLLDVTRADRSKLILKPSYFDIDVLIKDVVEDIQLISPEHKLIINEIDGVRINADKGRITQVITNLITNAIRYSPRSPDVYIVVKRQNDFIHISVQDFGIGMSKEQINQIFNRYFQVGGLAHNPGLGLGLFISKEIINKSGGEIWVESEVGKGTTFTFSLPCC